MNIKIKRWKNANKHQLTMYDFITRIKLRFEQLYKRKSYQ
jgi:hypothetical protein